MNGEEMTERLSRERVAQKVVWEGGVFEALRYGLRSREIEDPELARLWHTMESLYEQISPIALRIDLLLDRGEWVEPFAFDVTLEPWE